MNNHLGMKIMKLRKSLGFSRYKFAKEIGIHDINISRYEKGLGNPSIDTLFKIKDMAKKYGIEWVI